VHANDALVAASGAGMSRQASTVFVNTAALLAGFIRSLDSHEVIALDTEFMRERTYFPSLCLLQVAAGDSIWCIDPLAFDDLTPLFRALDNPARVKIIHAARQDLEIFFIATGRVPAPLFDTQIAAALLGRSDQIAYAALVSEFYALELDKSSSRTNWAQRPLSDRQLKYAADDVRYLEGVKRRLEDEIHHKGRSSWLEEECARLGNLGLYEHDPLLAWRKVKGIAKLESAQLRIVGALAAWREICARSRNLPRGWVVKDDHLIALACAAPRSKSELRAIAGLTPSLIRRHGEELLTAINAPETNCVQVDELGSRRLTVVGKNLVQDVLRALRQCAQDNEIAAALISTRRDIEMAICGRTDLRLYQGWRDGLFGEFVRQHIAVHSHVALYE